MRIRFTGWHNEVLVAYKSSPSFSDIFTDNDQVKQPKRTTAKLIILIIQLINNRLF